MQRTSSRIRPAAQEGRCVAYATAACVLLLTCLCMLAGCSGAPAGQDDSTKASAAKSEATTTVEQGEQDAAGSQEEASTEGEDAPAAESASEPDQASVAYPTGWLITASGDIPAGEPLQLLALPGMPTPAHRDGIPVAADEQARLDSELPAHGDNEALVSYDGAVTAVDPALLLVNLPDVMDGADYDVVYSYSSTSRCAGQAIPGVTDERLPGYADGRQASTYQGRPQFVAPCAYRTALKAMGAVSELQDSGYRLLVFDAYRPMRAQRHLSESFLAAYNADPVIRGSLGAWGLDWYVASGPSGHNFGTDLDVGLCDSTGTPIPMPSAFDAFDEAGHLCASPMNSAAITPASYCDAVSGNEACLALHAAFVNAGFSELASEWWHFGDVESEEAIRAVVGSGGLDFIALPAETEEG